MSTRVAAPRHAVAVPGGGLPWRAAVAAQGQNSRLPPPTSLVPELTGDLHLRQSLVISVGQPSSIGLDGSAVIFRSAQ